MGHAVPFRVGFSSILSSGTAETYREVSRGRANAAANSFNEFAKQSDFILGKKLTFRFCFDLFPSKHCIINLKRSKMGMIRNKTLVDNLYSWCR